MIKFYGWKDIPNSGYHENDFRDMPRSLRKKQHLDIRQLTRYDLKMLLKDIESALEDNEQHRWNRENPEGVNVSYRMLELTV